MTIYGYNYKITKKSQKKCLWVLNTLLRKEKTLI